MGRLHFECLGGKQVILCKKCRIYLTNRENLVSEAFRSSSGVAWLFKLVVNIDLFESEKKTMTTGHHMVRDISCKCCKTKLGWMYEFAFSPDQVYKENHFILEKAFIYITNGIPGDKNFVPHQPKRRNLSFDDETTSTEITSYNENDFNYTSLSNFNLPSHLPGMPRTVTDASTDAVLHQIGAAALHDIMRFARSGPPHLITASTSNSNTSSSTSPENDQHHQRNFRLENNSHYRFSSNYGNGHANRSNNLNLSNSQRNLRRSSRNRTLR